MEATDAEARDLIQKMVEMMREMFQLLGLDVPGEEGGSVSE